MDLNSLKYARTHEWVRREGDTVVIGISDFAVQSLTDLVYIQLPAVGKKVSPGEVFGEVESVKAVSDLYSPVAGEVIASHSELADNLGLLSDDPYGQGWLIKVRLSDEQSLSTLMDRAAYEQHCASEAH